MKRPTVKKHALIAVITASVLAASCTLPVLAANASAETDRTSVEADSTVESSDNNASPVVSDENADTAETIGNEEVDEDEVSPGDEDAPSSAENTVSTDTDEEALHSDSAQAVDEVYSSDTEVEVNNQDENSPVDDSDETETLSEEELAESGIEELEANKDWDYYINDDNKTVTIYEYKGSATNVTIPSTLGGKKVTEIYYGTFNNSNVKSIVIPATFTIISEGAFQDCTNLTSVTIPSSVKTIEEYAFSGCSRLKTIALPSGLTKLGSGAFYDCSALTSVNIPSGIKVIEESTFYDCSSLSSISLPASITSIGNYAFHGCGRLTSITLPSKVRNIGEGAFWECSKLSSVTIKGSDVVIGQSAFYYCKILKTVSISGSVTKVSDNAFDSTDISSITFPSGLTTIGSSAFSSCPLTSITLPLTLNRIGEYAFDTYEATLHIYYKGSSAQWNQVSIAHQDWEINDTVYFHFSNQIKAPEYKSITQTVNGLQFNWNSVKGAAGYRIYYCPKGGSWSALDSTTGTSYLWTGAKNNTTYYFTVRCLNSNWSVCSESSACKTVPYFTAPKISSMSNASKGVKVSWNGVTGAVKYRFYARPKGGSWKKIADTTAKSYTYTGVKSGTTYEFTVRVLNSKSETVSAYRTGSFCTFYAPPVLNSASNTSKGITLKWSAVGGAKNYALYYCPKGGSWKRLATATGTSYTWTGAKNGTNYTFTVRVVTPDGKSVVSASSNSKNITCKK